MPAKLTALFSILHASQAQVYNNDTAALICIQTPPTVCIQTPSIVCVPTQLNLQFHWIAENMNKGGLSVSNNSTSTLNYERPCTLQFMNTVLLSVEFSHASMKQQSQDFFWQSISCDKKKWNDGLSQVHWYICLYVHQSTHMLNNICLTQLQLSSCKIYTFRRRCLLWLAALTTFIAARLVQASALV